jgi:hypothetical protein
VKHLPFLEDAVNLLSFTSEGCQFADRRNLVRFSNFSVLDKLIEISLVGSLLCFDSFLHVVTA